ncbi:hypothetical protein DKT77_14195 [Meridianimarinicoccus roseus]|uniref:O-antigen ligase domain-containing protein n=1 Tax=Meridianimarinicoccus roseus TaxID=2072018 RepID=A0A2V2LFI5_9RHOB|nr:hypothetical protein [Meridianimarinicoccus roseus]PWR01957.1 hypothetical protein DKT77_14195 [Meridianimarinicoccus roseus]
MAYTRYPNGWQEESARTRGQRLGTTRLNAAPATPAAGRGADPGRAADGPARRGSAAGVLREKLPVSVIVFLSAVLVPLTMSIGGLALTPARIVMILLILPVLYRYVTGAAGRARAEDILLFLYAAWLSLAMLVYGGFGQIEFIGITVIETLFPFLLARCFIRTEAQYNALLQMMFVAICVLMVGAAIESVTRVRIFNRLFDIVGSTYPTDPSYEKRFGLTRAHTVFQHPIIYGVAMAVFFAPLFYRPTGDGKIGGIFKTFPVVMATFFSLSTGAWLALVIQGGLMVWDKIFNVIKARWTIFLWLVVISYVVIDLLSDRTPFEVFISYATLNQSTAYWRVLIFVLGMDVVWANPVFGIGLADWPRPSWMHSASVDNFWLLQAMRYGILGFLFSALMWLVLLWKLARIPFANERLRLQRNAFVYAFSAIAVSLCTVHVWGTASYLIMFMLGSASWMHDAADDAAPSGKDDPAARRRGARAR